MLYIYSLSLASNFSHLTFTRGGPGDGKRTLCVATGSKSHGPKNTDVKSNRLNLITELAHY